ncbi:MAG: hypothetical protein COA42_11715 [Alteromonadaceae bacterium]|nr:MAG: hypothetical protein COA42_11715 [Alteromonadaceae bacterium]
MLGDISLAYTQRIEQSVNAGFLAVQIPGLAGQVMQKTERHSHQVNIQGIIFGEDASDALKTLQTAATEGEELTFTASITDALDIQQVIIDRFKVVEDAARPGFYQYSLALMESPPLPPPAELSGFGGLDDFGLGDLGFDTDILGDLMDQVGDITDAIDQAGQLLDQLGALSNLDGLSVGGLLEPMDSLADGVSALGGQLGDALDNLLDGF